MKKILLAFVALFMVVSVNAQTGKKALKLASKSVAKYATDLSKVDQLTNGLSLLDTALQAEEVANDAKSLTTAAGLYNKIAEAEINQRILNPGIEIPNPNASIKAFELAKKALEAAGDNKKVLKNLYKLLPSIENSLNNVGITLFEAQKYGEAFKFYAQTIDALDLMKAQGVKSRVAGKDNLYKDQLFYTGVSGFYSDNKETSLPYFTKLDELGATRPTVYEALYAVKSAKGDADALSYLSKGRELFPDDTNLLFTEINAYAQAGKTEELLTKLESAKEKEPDNVSVVLMLGNVYDQLSQSDKANSNKYFDKAMATYEEVIAKDPKNFSAYYGQGSLWYNKAANMVPQINALGEDYSDAGLKKYEALKATMTSYFDKALPFFLKAETANPKDENTLIALKEIYAKKSDFAKSNEYKAKLESLR